MEGPENLLYTQEHEWIRVDKNNAIVGITQFAQDQLGDIVFVDVDTEGEMLDKDEVFGTIEAVKTVSDLFMPVSGEVLEFNEKLTKKFSEKYVKDIKSLRSENTGLSQKDFLKKIEIENNIKCSISTLKKMLDNEY